MYGVDAWRYRFVPETSNSVGCKTAVWERIDLIFFFFDSDRFVEEKMKQSMVNYLLPPSAIAVAFDSGYKQSKQSGELPTTLYCCLLLWL